MGLREICGEEEKWMGYDGAGEGWSVLTYVIYMCEIVSSNLIKMKTRIKN